VRHLPQSTADSTVIRQSAVNTSGNPKIATATRVDYQKSKDETVSGAADSSRSSHVDRLELVVMVANRPKMVVEAREEREGSLCFFKSFLRGSL
jgi:hypothetical protein